MYFFQNWITFYGVMGSLRVVLKILSRWYLSPHLRILDDRHRKQGRIHGSISRVRVGRGTMVAGQGQ